MQVAAVLTFLCILAAAPLQAVATDCHSEVNDPWMSLLQHAAVIGNMDSLKTDNRQANETSTFDCDNIGDLQNMIGGFVNNSSSAVGGIVDTANDTINDIVEQVDKHLDAATKALASAKSAVAMAAAFGKGGDTVETVGTVLDEMTPKLEEVKAKLQDLISKVLEKLQYGQKFNETIDGASEKYISALDQVSALCGLDSAELEKKDKGDFNKVDSAIADANNTVAELDDIISDLNATAFEQFDVVFDYVDNTLTTLKESLLEQAAEQLDGKIPAPVMAIVTKKLDDAFAKLLGVIDDVKLTIVEQADEISEQTANAKAQLAPAFEATEGMTEITSAARQKAGVPEYVPHSFAPAACKAGTIFGLLTLMHAVCA